MRSIYILTSTILALITIRVTAQNPHSQSKILELNYNNYKASDFGIQNAKNVVACDQMNYRIKFEADGFDLNQSYHLQFKKEKLTLNNFIFFYSDDSKLATNSSYFYRNNYKTLDRKEYLDQNGVPTEKYNYIFDKKGRLIEVDWVLKHKNQTTTSINYNDSKRSIEKYDISDSNGHKYNILTFKTNALGNIIEKSKKATKYDATDKLWNYEYDKNQHIIKASQSEKAADAPRFSTIGMSDYKYNSKGLIIEEKGNYSDADFNIDNHNYYEYVFDQYGNWIAKYKYTTQFGFTDLKSENYKDVQEMWLRKLTYKNGVITGSTDEKASTTQDFLNKISQNNPFKTKLPPQKGAYYSRESKDQIRFFIDGKNISARANLYITIGNHSYLNDSLTNRFYQLKDVKTKPIQKDFYKANVIANNNELAFLKNQDNTYTLILNGKYLGNKATLKNATNNEDIVIFLNNEPRYVLLNIDTVIMDSFQKGVGYKEYLKTHPKEGKKEEIPNGFVWKKNTKNSFWIYKNGIVDLSKKIAATFFNDQLVYDETNNRTYLLKDFTALDPETFYPVTTLSSNVFWYKVEDNRTGMIKNASNFAYSKLEYAQNGIDVVVYDADGAKKYILKDFVKNPAFVLHPVVSYSNYTEKPSANYQANLNIINCQEDAKCLAALYDEKYAEFDKVTYTTEELAQNLANYVVRVYKQKPHLVFSMLLKSKSDTDILSIMMEKLPIDVRDGIKTSSRNMLNDYNKYINSKEVQDEIKKNGGVMINK